MDNFVTSPRARVYFGMHQEEQVAPAVVAAGGKRVLLLYGQPHVTDPELLTLLKTSLQRQGLYCLSRGGVYRNAPLDFIHSTAMLCRSENIDFIVAIGGGSVINSAKAVAVSALQQPAEGEDPHNFDCLKWLREGQSVTAALKLCCIITVPGSGEAISERGTVSVRNEDATLRLYDFSAECLMPSFVICNPALVTSFPKHLGISCANIMVRVLERYFTNSRCVELTDRLCEGIMVTVRLMLQRLRDDPDDYEARANIMWAALLSDSQVELDREQDLALERFEHALVSLYDCSHGQAVALLTPAWMEFVLRHNPLRLAQFAHRVFNVPLDFSAPQVTALRGIECLRQLFDSLGLPRCFEDLGGSGADIPLIMQALDLKEGERIGSYVKLSRADCEVILSIVLLQRGLAVTGPRRRS